MQNNESDNLLKLENFPKNQNIVNNDMINHIVNSCPLLTCQTKESQLERLLNKIREYNSDEKELEVVKKAFYLAYEKHKNQCRKSGEPYFIHPYEVSLILSQLNSDHEMITAGLLHDVLEDTDYTVEEMEEEFGTNIYQLVDGVTKLSKFSFLSKQERRAENFRRMFLAMAKDIRVIVIKLADRLHNMRTLSYMTEEKQKEISKETLDIFAPLAHRLGIGRIKWELEDACLRYLHPEEYWKIRHNVSCKRQKQREYINNIINQLKTYIYAANIEAEISEISKHFYSIYEKMQKQKKEFYEVYDDNTSSIRIKVKGGEKECYEVLGIVHSIWKPIPGKIKDYIAIPKPNMYQSLHTTLIGNQGKPIEVQIRTYKMHHVAEYGITAHWLKGKDGRFLPEDLQLAWLRQLIEWQKDLKDADEFMDNVKVDLFSEEVFVFSPKGDIYNLKADSTPVDFAYRVHTHVGHRCIGAKINGRSAPLSQKLKNGDQVEIITSDIMQPRLDWLDFVATNLARNQIRKWFKKERREENIKRGKEILTKEFERFGLELKIEELEKIAEKLKQPSVEDLIAAVAYGEVTSIQIINRLQSANFNLETKFKDENKLIPKAKIKSDILVNGVSGLMVNFPQCCAPVPGESIVGVLTKTKGVLVHISDCPNLEKISKDKIINVSWEPEIKSSYCVELDIETIDRLGLLKDILVKISDSKTNLLAANVSTFEDKTARINLVVEVNNIKHLQKLIQIISQISDVLHVTRTKRPSKNMKYSEKRHKIN